MATCPGKRDHGGTCYKTVHRCKTCGSVGCDQGAVSKCTNKNFQYGKCLKCGKSGKEPV